MGNRRSLAGRLRVGTLRLLEELIVPDRHDGEVFGCAYTPDGTAVLSAGWDGQLRFWNVATGDAIASLKVSGKPLSSCGFTPDGKHWLSGSMEGLLGIWNAETQESIVNFVAHTRPISSIRYCPGRQATGDDFVGSPDRLAQGRQGARRQDAVRPHGHRRRLPLHAGRQTTAVVVL